MGSEYICPLCGGIVPITRMTVQTDDSMGNEQSIPSVEVSCLTCGDTRRTAIGDDIDSTIKELLRGIRNRKG